MAVLIPIAAAILILFGFGLAVGTVGRRRTRTPRALPWARTPALASGDPEAARNQLYAECVALRRALEAVAAKGEALLGLDAHVDTGGRRPLWRRLSDEGHLQAAAALRDPLVAWLDASAGLTPPLAALIADARPALAELAERLEAERPPTSDELAALQRAIDRAIAALAELERQLIAYRPRTYR
ncbi:MAG: hypothetical protein H6711_16785 [Myxococcales bacterium]|nr:hypothetical protein [Myxococcales bacterium]